MDKQVLLKKINELSKHQDWSQMEQVCSEGLQHFPESASIYHNRAISRKHLERYQEAKNDLEKALQIRPNQKQSLHLLKQINNEIAEEEFPDTLGQINDEIAKSLDESPTNQMSPSQLWNQEGKNVQQLFVDSTVEKKQFGRYQIVEELGRGGMGRVYKAYDGQLNRHIALKVIISGEAAQQKEVDRFLQEAKATAGLKHPNIVKVYDIGIEGNAPYFTMDLIEGISLKQYLQKPSRDIRKIIKLMIKIAEALHYAHKQDIIHRDIKPANIMISTKDNIPLVMDFGLAKVNSDQQLSKTGDVIGTPAYMSPEQAQGQTIDKTTDVYALGATLYEIITSRPPFQGETYFFIVKQILEDEPIAPRILNPEIPIELEAICLKALEKNRTRRYSSANVLARDLSNFLKNKPIIAKPPTKYTKLKKWLRQNAALAFFILLLLGLVFWTLIERQKAIKAEKKAKIAERKVKEEKEKILFQLAQVALARASEVSDSNWNQTGGFAGKALTFINKIELSQNLALAKKLREDSKSYIHWALVNSGLLFKANIKGYGHGISWSPDGKMFASCGWDKTVRIWDFATGKQVKQFLIKKKLLNDIVYSPNGKTLAVAAAQTLLVYNVASGKKIREFKHKAFITAIAYSPNSEILASSSRDGTAKLWDLATGKKVKEFDEHQGYVATVVFSPNGKILATGSYDKIVRVWDFATGKKISQHQKHTDAVLSLAFSPDGKQLTSGSMDKKIIVWSIKSGKIIKILRNLSWVNAIAYHQDGKILASSAGDGIKIWDIENGKVIKQYTNHYIPNSLAYSPDGKILASTASDRTVKLWDVDNRIVHQFPAPKHPAIHSKKPILYSPNGKTLIYGIKKVIVLLHISTGKVRYLQGHKGNITALALSPNTNKLISASQGEWRGANLVSSNHMLKLWDLTTDKEIQTFTGSTKDVKVVAYSPNGKTFATGSDDNTVRFWDIASGKQIYKYTFTSGGKNFFRSMVYSPDGKILASSGGKKIHLWDAKSGKQIKILHGHKELITALLYNPSGKILVSASIDKTIRFWDINTGKQIKKLLQPDSMLLSMVYNPDYKTIACTSNDKVIFWDIASGRVFQRFIHEAYIRSIAYHPNGKELASITNQSVLRIWDVQMVRSINKIPVPKFIAYNPNNANLIASISQDNKVKVWELSTGKQKDNIKIDDSWKRQSILKVSNFARYNFRLYIPAWLIAIALDKCPEKITQSLFQWKVNDDLSIAEQNFYE